MLKLLFSVIVFFGLSVNSFASSARSVKCDDVSVVRIYVRPNTGVKLNFPVKPDDVVFGGSGMFSVKYVKNDVHVSPISGTAATNMTVYFLSRSCTFKLMASRTQGDEIILVRDTDLNKMKVKPE